MQDFSVFFIYFFRNLEIKAVGHLLCNQVLKRVTFQRGRGTQHISQAREMNTFVTSKQCRCFRKIPGDSTNKSLFPYYPPLIFFFKSVATKHVDRSKLAMKTSGLILCFQQLLGPRTQIVKSFVLGAIHKLRRQVRGRGFQMYMLLHKLME